MRRITSKARATTIYPILFNFVISFAVYVNQILCQFIGLRINAIDDRYRSVRSKINKMMCGVLV